MPADCDPYQILGEVGRGGMGIVYRAQDPILDRTVAIKMIRTGGLEGYRFAVVANHLDTAYLHVAETAVGCVQDPEFAWQPFVHVAGSDINWRLIIHRLGLANIDLLADDHFEAVILGTSGLELFLRADGLVLFHSRRLCR